MADAAGLDLAALAARLRNGRVGRVQASPFLVRVEIGDYALTIFPDGRAIVAGTADEALAATLYARYVGM